MIKLLILGPTGQMGRLISELALNDDEIEVVAACDLNNIGEGLGGLLTIKEHIKIKISDVNNLQQIIEETKPDVAVDFTVAKATETNCRICVNNGIKCVIGTTAMSQGFLDEFETLVKSKKAPAVISPNMATGVNVLFKISSVLAKNLSEWDIEIIESHHNRKRDNYSGTSLKILEKICESLNIKEKKVAKYGRALGTGLREKGAKKEIGIHSIRAGDLVGEHRILFAGPGEYIELKHNAINRECFANGAIKAIKYIVKQKENKIFEMKDVLNI
ncbi:MAG: 4-hydroxy-tetrahydrodipicolinate reductase [Promethearchaeota archaeon]